MTKRIVSVGDLVVDLLLDVKLPVKVDEHQMSQTVVFEPGGASTTIFAARQMGLDVTAIGTVGSDFQGQMIIESLDNAGVDTSALVIPTNSTTTTVVALADSIQNGHVFLGHYGQGEHIELTSPAEATLTTADAVFMPGYTVVEERLHEFVQSVFELLGNHQLPFYFDVGPFAAQLPAETVETILQLVDVLLLTEDEILSVTGGQSGVAACAELLDTYTDMIIVIKTGASGCHILSQVDDIYCEGYSVNIVDTIGAGDSFAAAFMWAHLNGYSLKDCGKIANAMGAASVEKAGAGRNVPSKKRIQSILDANQENIKLR